MDTTLIIHQPRNLILCLVDEARKIRPITALLFILCYFPIGAASAAAGNEKLAEIHETIKHKYETLQHVNATQFETMSEDDLIIFDVREQSEFDVSHLTGAIRIAPDIAVDDFIASYREITNGKTLVFYCSVGRRSSELASRVQNELLKTGATEIYNLEGGIFRWHNDSRALVSAQQASDFVHPYNNYRGRLIDRAEMIRYQAQQ